MQVTNVGIAGLGVVGLEVYKKLINAPGIEVVAVSARDRDKDRGVDIPTDLWVSEPTHLAMRNNVDLVIEAIGGAEGAANDTVKTALENGKDVVTANKNLIATHGKDLSELANNRGAVLAFEAAVAGGIDIVKPSQLRVQGGDKIIKVSGIFNGTCNYILTRMAEGLSFDAALEEAQQKGYAETPDPSADTKGIDAAYKIAIMSGICYGHMPKVSDFSVEGIEDITKADINDAQESGHTIKLIASSSMSSNKLSVSVAPVVLPNTDPLSRVNGVLNAALIEAESGTYVYQGPGAGGLATASAVISDVMNIRNGAAPEPFPLGLS